MSVIPMAKGMKFIDDLTSDVQSRIETKLSGTTAFATINGNAIKGSSADITLKTFNGQSIVGTGDLTFVAPTIRSGTAAPDNAVGINGDMYFVI